MSDLNARPQGDASLITTMKNMAGRKKTPADWARLFELRDAAVKLATERGADFVDAFKCHAKIAKEFGMWVWYWPGENGGPRSLWIEFRSPAPYGQVLSMEWEGEAGIDAPGRAQVLTYFPGGWEARLLPPPTRH